MGDFRRFLLRMTLFVAAAVALAAFLAPTLARAFQANPALNGLIGGVLLIGIVHAFRQVLALVPELRWLRESEAPGGGAPDALPPRLLAPIARVLEEQASRRKTYLSALSMRALLDAVSFRLDEARDISRYMIGLLVFLGLLGTFWGLLRTVESVGTVVGGLSVQDEDIVRMFATLKGGLEQPLAGMGTAFSSSLFGLGGSLVLGFLDLQSGQAQNQFYTRLEEWLSTRARLTSAGLGGDAGSPAVPAYVQALLEQSAESIDELQKVLVRDEGDRRTANETMAQLSQQIAALGDLLRADREATARLAERAAAAASGGGIDEASRDHLRSMDVLLKRLVEEGAKGRKELLQGLQGEIRLLAKTVAAGAAPPPRRKT